MSARPWTAAEPGGRAERSPPPRAGRKSEKRTPSRRKAGWGPLYFSDNELLQIALAQPQRLQHGLFAALKGLVLHLDAGEAVVADVGQGGDKLAPVHVAQAGQLGGHEVQGIGHHAHTGQLLRVQLDVLVVDVEYLVLELVQGLDVVDHLPHEVAGVVVDAQVLAGQDVEHLVPVHRGGHQVLPAGPLVAAEQHGAVLNGDAHVQLLRQGDDGGPDLLDQLQVLLHALGLVAADEGGDHVDAQLCAGADDVHQVGDVGGALFQVAVHGVGVEGQGGDLHMVGGGVVQDVPGVGVVLAHPHHVDVADAGVAALRLTGGPAGHLHAGKAHFGHGVDHFLIPIRFQYGGHKAELHIVCSSQ